MHGSFRKTAMISVVLGGLLASGVLVTASLGAAAAIVAPETIELTVGDGVKSHTYKLRDTDGRRSASLDVYREPVLDADGTHIGAVLSECLQWGTGERNWTCSSVAKLKDGPYTDAGTVTFEGIFRGFNGEQLAVTGGTGAYSNVRGTVVLAVQNDGFVRTLNLIP
jgi:hypothetical protein